MIIKDLRVDFTVETKEVIIKTRWSPILLSISYSLEENKINYVFSRSTTQEDSQDRERGSLLQSVRSLQ